MQGHLAWLAAKGEETQKLGIAFFLLLIGFLPRSPFRIRDKKLIRDIVDT
jgi:hypothetical protein